jgi:sulfate permease, SulP family
VNRLRRFVPLATWLPAYQRSWLPSDIVAGVTIWGLLIPEMIAYASLAGLRPQAGLYTLLASLGIYAIFGTSKQLVVAGTSASAILLYSTVTSLAPKTATSYTTLAAGMVVLTGILFVVSGLLKLGFITSFLSRPVMEGFVFGLAVFVTVSQLPKLFGLTKGSGDTIEQLAHVIANLGDASWTTFAVGALSLGALFALERLIPRLPGGLVVLVVGITLSALLGLGNHGVATVGSIPTGLPSPAWPHLKASDLWILLSGAAGMMLVIFSEALGAGQTFADKHGYRLDSSQEMLALGLANIGSGVLGGLACGGSLSQTAVNDSAGAQSEISPIVAFVLSLITIVALTPLFKDLPEAVLAALIIHAVSHLMKVGEMRKFYRLVPREFWLGALTMGGVVILDILPGLIIGVVTSLVLFVYVASRPPISVLGQEPGAPGVFVDVRRHPEAVPPSGVLIVRPDAPLFYANAEAIRTAVESMVSTSPKVRAIAIDIDANDDLDITTAEELMKLVTHMQKEGVAIGLVHVHAPAVGMAARAGLLALVGEDQLFADVPSAVSWGTSQLRRHPEA